MGVASLGFSGGPSLTFRIDPESVDYKVKVFTNVEETVGGRVVQITGTQVSDVVVSGSIGEDHGRGRARSGEAEHPGVSWKLAEEFFRQIRSMMLEQAKGSSQVGSNARGTLRPAVFVYAPLGLRFECYIKGIVDQDGDGSAAVAHKVGRANYKYTLTLFPVLGETELRLAGQSANGVLDRAKASAIDAYIGRISQGIGWRFTAYNGGSTPSAPWDPAWAKANQSAKPNSTLENNR
jgi:hypothetical protein